MDNCGEVRPWHRTSVAWYMRLFGELEHALCLHKHSAWTCPKKTLLHGCLQMLLYSMQQVLVAWPPECRLGFQSLFSGHHFGFAAA